MQSEQPPLGQGGSPDNIVIDYIFSVIGNVKKSMTKFTGTRYYHGISIEFLSFICKVGIADLLLGNFTI